MGKFTQNMYGKKWVKKGCRRVEFLSDDFFLDNQTSAVLDFLTVKYILDASLFSASRGTGPPFF
jgi:hypothetical protein